MEITPLSAACVYVDTGDTVVRFGCTPDAPKLANALGLRAPDVVVVHSEPLFRYSAALCALEFDLWGKMFSPDGYLATGQPLHIVCEPHLIDRVRTLLRLAYEGPSDRQLAEFGLLPREPWLGWRDKLAVRDDTDQRVPLEDVIRILPLQRRVEVMGLVIEADTSDRFLLTDHADTTCIDVRLSEPQEFVFPTPVADSDPTGARLAFHVLGCYSGVEPGGGTTCYRVVANGLEYILDGMAGLRDVVTRLGMPLNDTPRFLLSHTHQDHIWGAMEQVLSGNCIRLIAAPEVFASFVCMAAAISGQSHQQIRKLIDWTLIEPGHPVREFGIDIEAEWVVSPVPTTGFRVSVGDAAMVFSGDTLSPGQMVALGLPQHQVERVADFCLSGDIAIVDCGGAGGSVVHGIASEWIDWAAGKHELLGTHTALRVTGMEMARPGLVRVIQSQITQAASATHDS